MTFHQPIHSERLINGFVARAPLAALDYYRKSPALMFLANETPPPGDLDADLRRRLAELHVDCILVHPDMVEPSQLQRILALLSHVDDLTPIASREDLIAFRRGGPGT